ncbi:MAG: Gfo/Idh/MocA family oxidoreductase [Patescibacteria group bacterium]
MPQKQQRFAIIGVGGYIAPRHLKAIKDTGNTVIAALDPHDSVGLLDSFFPNTQFFTEFERFDRHAEKLKRQDEDGAIQYVSICSPNYLHDAHIRFALRIGAHAICEKPLVLNPWNIDALKALEDEYGKRVYTILQLRVHPVLKKLKAEIEKQSSKEKHTVELTYITSRGAWYLNSWKGQSEKSGGLATNIGIHFFDLLIWLFGPVKLSEVYSATDKETSGYLELENANVRWFLSIDEHKLPQDAIKNGKRTFRSLTVDKKEIEFSEGFTDLHTVVYKQTLDGKGFGLEDAKPAIALAHEIRTAQIVPSKDHAHPYTKKNA